MPRSSCPVYGTGSVTYRQRLDTVGCRPRLLVEFLFSLTLSERSSFSKPSVKKYPGARAGKPYVERYRRFGKRGAVSSFLRICGRIAQRSCALVCFSFLRSTGSGHTSAVQLLSHTID